MPDVPTLEESGVKGAESGSWLGLLAPASTPKEIIEKISMSLQQAVAVPEIQQQMIAQGGIAKGGSPADFAQLIASDRKRYARLIIDNKLAAD
jgi:tripartite-type tricarboxylate transporter receptor subunit TctC